MELLIKQIARAEQSGEKAFAQVLRDIANDDARLKKEAERIRIKSENVVLLDPDR